MDATFKVLSLLNKRIQTEEQLKRQERAFPDRNAVIKRRLLQLPDWVPMLVDTHLIPEGFRQNTRDTAGVFSVTSSHSQKAFFLFPLPPAPLARLLLWRLCRSKLGLQTHSACYSCRHQSIRCVPQREPLAWTRAFSENCGVLWGRNAKRVPVLNATKDLQRAGHLFLK